MTRFHSSQFTPIEVWIRGTSNFFNQTIISLLALIPIFSSLVARHKRGLDHAMIEISKECFLKVMLHILTRSIARIPSVKFLWSWDIDHARA